MCATSYARRLEVVELPPACWRNAAGLSERTRNWADLTELARKGFRPFARGARSLFARTAADDQAGLRRSAEEGPWNTSTSHGMATLVDHALKPYQGLQHEERLHKGRADQLKALESARLWSTASVSCQTGRERARLLTRDGWYPDTRSCGRGPDARLIGTPGLRLSVVFFPGEPNVGGTSGGREGVSPQRSMGCGSVDNASGWKTGMQSLRSYALI